VRNFFRKYPISGEVTDLEQLQIERKVGSEMENFIQSTQQINSKNLQDFEAKLSAECMLKRRTTESGAS